PVYPLQARRAVLEGVLAKAGLSKVVNNFLLFLQDKNRMQFLDEISRVYANLVDELAGVMRATVSSAAAVSAEVEQRVKATLEKLTGKQIVIEFKEDPELIGGLTAQVGDLVLDGSVRTQLGSLKDSLKGMG
ncbi:MAG: ATP synthase F1 subunit delta, partial [Deltaproteobacteria bacterium]|nr:ATP synthase F1 subunit delta [Deltaproteobacteria bacterium]